MVAVLNKIFRLLLVGFLLCLPACGGGGGSSSSDSTPVEQAIITLALAGPGTDMIGSVQFDLILPDNFAVDVDSQGLLVDGVVALMVPGTIVSGYQEQTPSAYGEVNLGVIDGTLGLVPGNLVAITYDLDPFESRPLPVEFTIENLEVSDGSGLFPGYSITISVE